MTCPSADEVRKTLVKVMADERIAWARRIGTGTSFGRSVCIAPDGSEVARGLVNYSAEETRKIMRQPSSKIEELLGYVDEPELIHRDNLVLVA